MCVPEALNAAEDKGSKRRMWPNILLHISNCIFQAFITRSTSEIDYNLRLCIDCDFSVFLHILDVFMKKKI